MTDIERLQQMVDKSHRIVFFGGAGVSTESGIPDFRGVDGLYRQKYPYPPETMLSHDFFEQHTAEFFDFYRDKMLCLDAQPNPAHQKLAELERAGKLTACTRKRAAKTFSSYMVPSFGTTASAVENPTVRNSSATAREFQPAHAAVPSNRTSSFMEKA